MTSSSTQTKTKSQTPSEPFSSHGWWCFDYYSEVNLGPASEELLKQWLLGSGRPIIQNRHGYPHHVVLRKRDDF